MYVLDCKTLSIPLLLYYKISMNRLIVCEKNEPGMVVMRTSDIHQFRGYYGDDKKSEEKKIHNAFEEDDCWINSGDLMVMDDEFEVFFCNGITT